MTPIATVLRWMPRWPRWRLLLWPVLVTVMCGVLDAGMPLDRFFESARDAVRAHAADGTVAVVKIDDRSIRSLPWANRGTIDAGLLDALFALGARRVVFDQAFSEPSPGGDDAVFVRALRRFPGRVVVGARFEDDHRDGERSFLLPVPVIRRAALLASYNVRRDPLGYTTGVPYASEIAGRRYPSFAALLANRTGAVDELFEPDFAIDYQTVPSVSLIDVLRRTAGARVVAGRDVFVGSTADSLGDTHMVPRQGPLPGVYIHALATQTLRTARPRQLGWLPCYAVALAISLGYVATRRRDRRAALGLAGYGVLVGVPLLLDGRNVEVAIVPALALLTTVIVREHLRARRLVNPATGLPTLDRFHHRVATSPVTLVGVRLRNYANLRLSLTEGEERALLAELVRRLRIAGHVADLMHVDDTFVWTTDLPVSRTLLDHVEGLHAILAAPVDAGSRRVDLSFAFGIDDETQRPLASRIGGVQLSADLAAAAGAKWKVNNANAIGDADFRLSLPSEIEQAIAAGEIWVAYQPKMTLHPAGVHGAEALVRWTHPERGVIAPDRFIPAVEEVNRIEGLTYFVLETAIADARRLERLVPGFTVAVNLSVRMLTIDGMVDHVVALLRRYGLAPQRLTLEVTESLPIGAEAGALAALARLRAAGIGISIDDYGTKFSTLEYIRSLPATEIKIDRQFAERVHLNEHDAIMVASTIRLAHDLRLNVVAEGVEDAAAYRKLDELGCDVIQGYLVGRPMPFAALSDYLRRERVRDPVNNYRLANHV